MLAGLRGTTAIPAHAQQAAPAVKIDADDIGGVVSGPNGPEAGVWVIAETRDLPTKFAKVVVTDDQGRYVIPDLPKGAYDIWVRGYGLIDSPKLHTEPGKLMNLRAVPAPSEAAAAEYYPGMYWYSMIQIPAKSEFPGTGDKGNHIPDVMKTQAYWIDTVKNSCQSCHALGTRGVRQMPKELISEFKDPIDQWTRRLQSGQPMSNMALTMGRLGDKRAELHAYRTTRIHNGERPTATPRRPATV